MLEMDAINILELISNLGFPIACAVAMGYFIYKIYLNTAKEKEQILDLNAQNMERYRPDAPNVKKSFIRKLL